MKTYRKPFDLFLYLVVRLAAILTLFILVYLIGYILIRGIPYIKPSLFEKKYTSDNVSVYPAIISTASITCLSLLFAVPFGIFTAIYLVEYAKKGNKVVEIIRLTTETLAGIPSIVYGLFGRLFFVIYLGIGASLLSGSLTVSIMILPLIIRSTEEALKSVPDSFREGAYGLGAGRLRTIFRIVLPSAIPGIFAGIILAIGRIVGETAAFMYTAGTSTDIPKNIFSSGRTLALHMYLLSSEGFHTNEAFATAVILVIMVIGINAISAFAAKKLVKG